MTNPKPIIEVPDPVNLPDWPPTQDELPYDDGVPMGSWRHKCQMDLLISVTQTWLQQRPDGFVSGNMFLYYNLEQTRSRNFRGPDYFVVLGVPKGERKSWVIWEQGKGPDVVIELLSPSTAQDDKTSKKQLYEQIIRVPEYFWFDPFEPEDWAGFRLRGDHYEPIEVDAGGRLPSAVLGLYLVKWEGRFRDIETTWIRWATSSGELVPTEAELERQRAEQERQRAEQAEQRAERLAQKLRELGVDPGTLG
ncbi:Uma2 family endonuclease [Synechococcus sp. OH20]|uniref:Uma2 family endonuclease n=1 Tax=Synechococcus sp. OH20 TaxID=139337 RepID=UPI0039C7284C